MVCNPSLGQVSYSTPTTRILKHFVVCLYHRFIAAESGQHPSLTRLRTEQLHHFLKPALCPTHGLAQNTESPVALFARLAEASAMLDKIHNAINCPTSQESFNTAEFMLTVQTAMSLQAILVDEMTDADHVYSGPLAVCRL